MNQTYVLFNPLAACGKTKLFAEKLAEKTEGAKLVDVRKISSYKVFFEQMEEGDRILLCGGDGTVNRFANHIADLTLPCPVYYYATGSGNDFARDIGQGFGAEPKEPINEYLKNLPLVNVNGNSYRFLNGVGYGIDGYCCEVGDEQREKRMSQQNDKPINYTAIAIKGLLFHFRPKNAVVTVDGVEHRFRKVWLAPTMHGHYYGGGMMPTPGQDRSDPETPMSLLVFHGTNPLHTLMIFPSLFKGEHVKHEKHVTILTGKEITVEYDRPCALQIDGETITNVTRYTAKASC